MKRTRLLIIIMVFILAFTICACGESAEELAYKEAMSLYDTGDYQNAIEKFQEIAEYKNSAEMILDSQYQKAVQLLTAKNTILAKKAFSELGDYKDSTQMVMECDYQAALSRLEENQFDYAQRLFRGLGEYKDSASMVLECKYQQAIFFLGNKENVKALKLFQEIETYKDAEDYIKRFETGTHLTQISISQRDNFGQLSTYREAYSYDYLNRIEKVETTTHFSLNESSPFIHFWSAQPNSLPNVAREIYEYDEETGLLIKITGQSDVRIGYTVTFEYNDERQIIRENLVTSDSTGYMDLSYNDQGQLTQVKADPTHKFSITYTYDDYGNVTSTYNSIYYGYRYNYKYTYNEAERISEVQTTTNFGERYHDTYSYDEEGNVEKIVRSFPGSTEPDVTITFSYDVYAIYSP